MTVPANLNGPIFFDRSGRPIDLVRYTELHADLGYRIVARDRVVGEHSLEVITAWLGMDQGFGDDPTPMIFGTIALGPDDDPWQGEERLAATQEQALLNHKALVAELS